MHTHGTAMGAVVTRNSFTISFPGVLAEYAGRSLKCVLVAGKELSRQGEALGPLGDRDHPQEWGKGTGFC